MCQNILPVHLQVEAGLYIYLVSLDSLLKDDAGHILNLSFAVSHKKFLSQSFFGSNSKVLYWHSSAQCCKEILHIIVSLSLIQSASLSLFFHSFRAQPAAATPSAVTISVKLCFNAHYTLSTTHTPLAAAQRQHASSLSLALSLKHTERLARPQLADWACAGQRCGRIRGTRSDEDE